MTLLNVSDLSHHYAHGGFNGKHQHQAVLNNVSLTLKSGETASVHFTVPDKPGTSLPFSCWMGMIRGVFVIE